MSSGTHTAKAGRNEESVGLSSGTHPRARARPFGDGTKCPIVPSGTEDRDTSGATERDSSDPGSHVPRRNVPALRFAAGRDHHAEQAPETFEEKTQAHAKKLAGDPRFAGWLAGMPTAPAGGVTEDRRRLETVELTRRCAVRVIENHESGRKQDPHTLQWARDFIAANPKLPGPLSTGEPA